MNNTKVKFFKLEMLKEFQLFNNTIYFFIIFCFATIPLQAQPLSIVIPEGSKPNRLSSPREVSKLVKWTQFSLSDGNFRISMPGKPGRHFNPKKLPQGFESQIRYFWDTQDEQLYFEAQILKISPTVSFSLNKGIEGFKQIQKSRNSELLSEKKIQVNSIEGYDLLYRIPDDPEPVLGYTRILLCGKRIYTLMGAGTKKQTDLFDVVMKYFNSFSPLIECPKKKKVIVNEQKRSSRTSRPTPSRRYIRGPRGGCYYVNSKNRKVYVDRKLCN